MRKMKPKRILSNEAKRLLDPAVQTKDISIMNEAGWDGVQVMAETIYQVCLAPLGW